MFSAYYNKIKRISSKEFVRNISVLMTGTVIAQIIGMALSPILSRIYEPSVFGTFGLFIAIVSVTSVLTSWRYEMAIVIPKKTEDAANIFFIAISVTVLMTILTFLLVLFGRKYLNTRFGNPSLEPLLWCLPIYIMAIGIYNNANFWFTRQKQFKRLSISRVVRSIVSSCMQTIIGATGFLSVGLVYGQMIGLVAGAFILIMQVLLKEKNLLFHSINYKRIKKLAVEYSSFSKYNSLQAFINSLSQYAPVFILTHFYGIKIVGFYTLTLRGLQLPVDLIGQSFRQVYFQKVSELYNNGGNVYLLLKKTTFVLIAIGIVPAFIVIFLGPQLFSLIFGGNWYDSGIYARWLTIWFFLGFVNIPAVMTAQIYMLQSYLLIYEIILLLRVLIFLIAALHLDATYSIFLYSITGAIFNLTLIITMMLFARKREFVRGKILATKV